MSAIFEDSDTELMASSQVAGVLAEGTIPITELQTLELSTCDNDGNPHGRDSVYSGVYVLAPSAAENGCDKTVANDVSAVGGIFDSWDHIPFATRIWPKGCTDEKKIVAATLFEARNGEMFYYPHTPELEMDCALETCGQLATMYDIVSASDPDGLGTAGATTLSAEARARFMAIPMYQAFIISPFAYAHWVVQEEYINDVKKSNAKKPVKAAATKKAARPSMSTRPSAPATKKPVTVVDPAPKKKLVLNLSKPKGGRPAKEKVVKDKPAAKQPAKRKAKPAALPVAQPSPKKAKYDDTPNALPLVAEDKGVAVSGPSSPIATTPSVAALKSPVRWKLIFEGDGVMPDAVATSLKRIWS